MRLNKFFIITYLFAIIQLLNAQTTRWRVIWNPNPPTDSVLYYEIHIGSDSNSVSLLDTVHHPHTEYIDSLGIGGAGLNLGETYYYKIRAVNQHGAGPLSDAAYASIPEITFSNLLLPVAADTSFSLNQSQFVSDPDYGINSLQWDVIDSAPGDSIQHSMQNSNTINFITPSGTSNVDLLQFRVFDADSFFDERSVNVSLTLPSFAPVISNIPDQTISLGQSFNTISLDSFVTDSDHSDSELTWTVSGENNLSVTIDPVSHEATITPNNGNWVGSETLTFRVTDPTLLFDEDDANFTIFGGPVVSDIQDQTIIQGESFDLFDLDSLVTDPDNDTTEITWTTSGENNLAVNIDATSHIVTITPDNQSWVGSETITFRATDPNSLFDEDDAVFTILAPPVVSQIPDQTIEKGEAFSTFDLDDYVSDQDHSDDQLTWTVSGDNNLNVIINSNSHIVTITLNDTSWTGSETINFRATDPDGLFDDDDVVFSVNSPDNNAPVIISTPIETAITGEVYLYIITASDSDGDSLFFSLINGSPNFLHIVRNDSTTDSSAIVSGIPPLGSDGVYEVTILVSDSLGGTDFQNYELTVSSSAIESIKDIYAYPTPFVVGKSRIDNIVFKNVPLNSELILYNLVGEPVYKERVEAQPFTWNVKNNAGLNVQSGLYFYYVRQNGKILKSGKIVIIR